jgi:uncharacterized protein (TIGR02996 family)
VSDAEMKALLRAAREQPEDDLPRLALADWLEEHGDGERAGLVRLQCELAHTAGDDPRRAGLKARERELLKAHARRWLGGLRRFTQSWQLERGLLFLQLASPDAFLHEKGQAERRSAAFAWVAGIRCLVPFGRGDRILPRLHRQADAFAGLTHLQLFVRCDRAVLARFLALPELGLLTHLDLAQCDVGDEGAAALAASPHLHRLRTLGLASCGVSDAGVAELARSAHLGRLERLCLRGNPVSDLGAEVLAGAAGLPSLREVDVSGQHMIEPRLGPNGLALLGARFGEGLGILDVSMPPRQSGQ